MSDAVGGVPLGRARRPSAARFVLATLFAIAVLLAMAAAIHLERARLSQAREAAAQVLRRRLALSELDAAVGAGRAAEHASRVSSDPAWIADYRVARARMARAMTVLAAVPAADAVERVFVDRLCGEVSERFAVTDRQVARGTVPPPPSLPIAHAVSGRLDLIVAAFQRHEDARLHAAWAAVTRRFRRDGVLLALLTGAGVIACIVAAWLWWRASCRHFLLERQALGTAARLGAIFSGTRDAMLLVSEPGRIVEANPAAGLLLGYAPEDLAGMEVNRVIVVDEHQRVMDRHALMVGTAPEPPVRADRLARHRDGHEIAVEIAVGVMPSDSRPGMVLSLRDVSERHAAEQMKDDFISTISHELRTPLTSVVGALGLLREGAAGTLPDAAARLVGIAENNARRLIRLVNDILDIDRLNTGRLQLDLAPAELRALAQQACRDAEGLAEPRRVAIRFEAPPGAMPVTGDGGRLLQVIGNLLSNAIRFSPAGNTVTVSLEPRGGEVVLRVDDNGPGVPREFRERLFGRFTQSASGAAIPGGTGLGLAISREIVRAHGGDIWYADRRGGGARFCFSLPLENAGAADGRRRLLLCEDDAQIAALLRDLLEDEGYVVDRCGSVAEASAMARTGRYEVLLLDLSLPDARGLDAVQAIRGDPDTRDLPVVVVSGDAARHAGDAAAAALDVSDWLAKPVDHAALLRALDAAIARGDRVKPVLLHVEDDDDVRAVVALALADRGRILQAGSLRSARAAIAAAAPAAAILDLDLPDGSGLELLPDLARAAGGRVPAVIYSAATDLPPVGPGVDAVLVKSEQSLRVLSETVGAILNRARERGELR